MAVGAVEAATCGGGRGAGGGRGRAGGAQRRRAAGQQRRGRSGPVEQVRGRRGRRLVLRRGLVAHVDADARSAQSESAASALRTTTTPSVNRKQTAQISS